MATKWTLGGDAIDPRRQAAFWAAALDYVLEPGFDNDEGASIIDPDGVGPAIGFLKVPEAKQAKNRFHVDIRVAGPGLRSPDSEQRLRAKAAALLADGATQIRDEYYEDQLGHIVMQDPEGNEFCVG